MLYKICGMTRQDDIDVAATLDFNFCGFIFHAASPRSVAPDHAAKLDTHGMGRVGVFVNQSANEIMEIMQIASLDYAQLHGPYTVADAMMLGPEKVIRVMWPERYSQRADFISACEQWANACAFFLLDSGQTGGGSGKTHATSFIHGITLPRPWFLAGGLNPENVCCCMEHNPAGLDVNSGLEISPGCKSHALMQIFMQKCQERK